MPEELQGPPYLCWKDDEDLTERVREKVAAGTGNVHSSLRRLWRLRRRDAKGSAHVVVVCSHGHHNVFLVPFPPQGPKP